MPSKPRSLAGILRPRRVGDAEYNNRRRDPVAARVYRSSRWTAVRARVLRDHPLCISCAAAGRTELAAQVDPIAPVGVRPDLAFDRANLQPICTVCRAAKSQAEWCPRGVGGGVHLSRIGPRERGARRVPFLTGFPVRAKSPSNPRRSGLGRVPLAPVGKERA